MQRHRVQEKKQLVFDASIDGSSTSLGKLTEQEGGGPLEILVLAFERISWLTNG